MPRWAPLVLVGFVVGGCTSGNGGRSSADDVATWCARFVGCSASDAGATSPTAQTDCENAWFGWVPPAGCVASAQSASCTAVKVGWFGSALPICFPACKGQAPLYCSGNLVTSCDVGPGGPRSATFDCNVLCARSKQTPMGCDATRSTDYFAACGCK